MRWAAHGAAVVIADIQSDVLGSFSYPLADPGALQAARHAADRHILVEGVEDNAAFAELVCQELRRLSRSWGNGCAPWPRCRMPISMKSNAMWMVCRSTGALRKNPGRSPASPQPGRKWITLIWLAPSVRSESCPSRPVRCCCRQKRRRALCTFPLVTACKSCRSAPTGHSRPSPRVQIGNTGVIRGALRNARVIAEHDVELLSIPREVFLSHWYTPYTVQEFTHLCTQGNIQAMLQPAARTCKGVTT